MHKTHTTIFLILLLQLVEYGYQSHIMVFITQFVRDHKPEKVPGHLIEQSFSLLRRVRVLGTCAIN